MVKKKKDQHLGTIELSASDLKALHVPTPTKAQPGTVELSGSDLEPLRVPRPTRSQGETPVENGAQPSSEKGSDAPNVPRRSSAPPLRSSLQPQRSSSSPPPRSSSSSPPRSSSPPPRTSSSPPRASFLSAGTSPDPTHGPMLDVTGPTLLGDASLITDNPFVKTIIDNRYEVIKCLGSGAMGSVFLVRHLNLGKLFALKMINPDIADEPEFVSRFQREADVSSRLDHPNCISVTDFGQTRNGSFFLVMEYTDGTPLSELLEQGPVPARDVLRYSRQVLLGLQHAHALGLVHRDIKPENIVKCRREDGSEVIKILDFGMAKVPVQDQSDVEITREGVVLGTPQYMAPEQIRDADIDLRVDLYAVGVTMLRMISGRQVFEGDTYLDVFARKFNRPAPSLHDLTGKRYPKALETCIAKALERDPTNRFSSAAEMFDALKSIYRDVDDDQPARKTAAALQTRIAAGLSGRASAVARRLTATSLAASRAIGGSVARFFSRIHHDVVTWYSCAEYHGGASLQNRLKSLFRTPSGQAVLLRALALTVVVSTLVVALIPDTKKPASPGINAAADASGDAPTSILTSSANSSPETAAADTGRSAAHAFAPKDDAPPNQALIEANLLVEQKKCRAAKEKLDTVPNPDTPRIQYTLGRVHMCLNQDDAALSNYRRAVATNPSYKTDARILEDAKKMLSNPKIRLDALNFMAEQLGDPALPALIQLAGHHPSSEIRHRAVALVDARGSLDLVDREASLELDLNQARTCKEKREIVQKLADLNTKKARQTLYRLRDIQVKDGFFRKRYKNECIRKDINRALSDMRTREQ